MKPQPDSSYDNPAVAVIKNDVVVGHIPKPVSRVVSYLLSRDGFCEVTGNRINCRVDLSVEVPCTYRFYGRQAYIDRLNDLLQ